MAIIENLYVDQYGAFIGKHSERLIVTQGDEKLAQAPLMHLESVVIANQGVSISAEAIRECTERGIPIYFISGTGTPYASLYSAGLVGTVMTRRAQFDALRSSRGVYLVLAFGMGKLRNQSTLIKYMAKYRKETAPELFKELQLLAAEIIDQAIEMQRIMQYPEYMDGTVSVDDLRQEIMGYEGNGAAKYWSAVKLILPEKYHFPGRKHRGAKDPINAALNYCYGILYGQIERALVLAGLDPYAGFLHVDRPGKPSLTLDFIEEFRPVVVDRTVFGMANKGVVFEIDQDNLLTKETRRMLAAKIQERLEAAVKFEGKRYPLRAVIQMQARHLATYLRCERPGYEAFAMSW